MAVASPYLKGESAVSGLSLGLGLLVLTALAAVCGVLLAVGEVEAVYVCLAVVTLIAVLFDFRVGVVLLIALLPVSASDLFPHELMGLKGLNPINILLGGTFVAYLLRGRLQYTGRLLPRPLLWLYIVPIVLAGLLGARHVDEIVQPFFDLQVVSFTDGPGYLRDIAVKPIFTVLAAMLVGAAVARAKSPERFITALAVGVCAVAFLEFGFIIASGIRLGQLAMANERGFFSGIGMHANILGRLFVTAYALLLFAWWETRHASAKLALMVVLGILSFATLFTFSRNALLGFFLINGLFLMWKFNAKKLGLALLAAAVSVALAPGYVYERITFGFGSGSANTVSAGRIDGIWLPLLPELWKSPLWGNGLGSVAWSHPMKAGLMDLVGHPHNAYLEAALDMGIIGLVLLLAYYWHVWKGFRALGSNPYLTPLMRGFFQGACAALIAFVVACMTGGSLRPLPENLPLWIAIGMMYGLLARRPAG